MQRNSYVVGMQDGERWRCHVHEDRSGIVALPTFTSEATAREYIEELGVLFVALELDPEQLRIVADMECATFYLLDPKNDQGSGHLDLVPLTPSTTSEA